MTSAIDGKVLSSAMARLVSERSRLDTQIKAIKTLTGYESVRATVGGFKKSGAGFIERIKEILSTSPGATSTQVKQKLDESGYVRPRAGGQIKKYDVPIALGRLAKSGEVLRVGGSKAIGFQYAVARR